MKKQRNLAYLACVSGLLLVTGCDSGNAANKDGGPSQPKPNDMDPGSDEGRKPAIPSDLLKSATVSGIVVDVRGNRVAGASVAVGALTAESNDDGEFDFHEIEVADDTTMIVTRDGYSTGRVPFSVSETAHNHVRVTLQAAEKLMLARPEQGRQRRERERRRPQAQARPDRRRERRSGHRAGRAARVAASTTATRWPPRPAA